jgi:hypothetical protein
MSIAESRASELPVCFVMMPITDPPGYPPGHFKHVFEDLLAPACARAGYQAVRADQIRPTNLIHVDVLRKTIESPMGLCDLSSHNPNVLFELGLRLAFEKPVLLVRDSITQDLFDIAPLRFTGYRQARLYHEVLEDQETIAAALKATHLAAGDDDCTNSIMRLLALPQSAQMPQAPKDPTPLLLRLLNDEVGAVKDELRRLRCELGKTPLGNGNGHGTSEGVAPRSAASEPVMEAAIATVD